MKFFIIATLAIFYMNSYAAILGNVTITGKIKKYDKKTVWLETRTGKLKIPRKFFTKDGQRGPGKFASLKTGSLINVKAPLNEIVDYNTPKN